MEQAIIDISSKQARNLYPLEKLSTEDIDELLRSASQSLLPPGTPLFRSDDLPKSLFYLLEGEVELITRDKGLRLVEGGSAEARMPMGRGMPGQISATARSDALIMSLDADMVELFLSWHDPEAYLAREGGKGNNEWLDKLLQSRGLLRFSEEQIETLLSHMSEVRYKAGEVVIRQDDADDYYYIVKHGRCRVSRQPEPGAREIKLAELKSGDAFGEEALLAGAPRSANIIMEEDGSLMRLSKHDFSSLLAQPLLSSVGWEDSHNMTRLGGVFLDVRLPDEFERQRIPGSVNIPLALLRLRLKQLSPQRKYIVCCSDGRLSAVAAFLLNRHGLDAFILNGGLNAAQPLLATRGQH